MLTLGEDEEARGEESQGIRWASKWGRNVGRWGRDKGKQEGAGNNDAAPSSAPRRFFYAGGGGGGRRRWIGLPPTFFFSLARFSFLLGVENIIVSFFMRSWEILFWFSQHTYCSFLSIRDKKNWRNFIVVK